MSLDRQCNECTLCCKLLPVSEIKKAANTRCVHQRSLRGCMIYRQDNFPRSCREWSCVWLFDRTTTGLARPDRSHYVIDPTPDYVTVDEHHIPVIQVWVDPKHRDAHRDPALRKYLLERYERFGQLALIRYNSTDALVLLPPAVSPTGKWLEHESHNLREDNEQHHEHWNTSE